MLERFRGTLNTFNDLIKEDLTLDEDQIDERKSVANRIAAAMQTEARKSRTSTGVQYEVFGIQEQKQELMQTLRAELRKIDEVKPKPERAPLGARHIIQRDSVLYWQRADGSEVAVTLGDILTDLAWNTVYHLDPVSIPRTIRKKFLIEQTRQKVEKLLDMQILTEESVSGHNAPLLREAYERSKAGKVNYEIPFGVLAERILVQLVKKWIIDGEIPFSVRPTDAFQDITQKIDFVIVRKEDQHARGVQIKKTHNLQAKAIQFTLQTDPDALRHKQEQIDRSKQHLRRSDKIDDLLLVTARSQPLRDAYNKWRDLGKPPGGPANVLTEDVQRYIFDKLMDGLLDQEESDSYWQQAA